MALSIDRLTSVIFVPLDFLEELGGGFYNLDLDTFRLALKDLEDDVEGMAFPATHAHTAPLTAGGVTLARVVELINGYTVEFEDGQYAVNLIGANSNLGDYTVVNQVSIRSSNSAGLVQVVGAGTTAAEVRAEMDAYSVKLGGISTTTLDSKTLIEALAIATALIKDKTDSLTFTKAGEVDSNVQSVNGVTLAGNGEGTPMGAA